MNLIADTHMHTVASTHAYSTVQEMVHAAAQKGLYAVAITDHGACMPGAPGKWYFENLKVIPRNLEGVLVLRGEEADVIDYDGNTDLIETDLDILDWVVASIHRPIMKEKNPTVEQVTNAWMNIARNPRVNVIGHSGTAEFAYDFEKVIPEFGRNGKLVELNESSFVWRQKSLPNCKKIMELCKKHSVPIIVNTDSHFSTQVGCFNHSLKLLEELDFPEELVVNSSVERFQSYLKQYTRVFNTD
ncbi:MAG TPA: phosphatase [Caproiciproducens sp.]|nr:phosphatase [Caproiciproducens sp.]